MELDSQKWRRIKEWFIAQPQEPDAGFSPRTSAVLVIIGDFRGRGAEILLTKRTGTVADYKGHVSFPGGRAEDADLSLRDTALRESEEEIGLSRANAEIVGTLPPVTTREGTPIRPFIAWLTAAQAWTASPDEVERILFLPAARLIDEGLTRFRVPIADLGIVVDSPGIMVDGELVWGATARILIDLRERLRSACEVLSR